MNLQQFLIILRARALLVLGTLGLVVAVAMAVSFLMPPRYTATSSIVIDFRGLDPVSGNILPALLLPSYMATQVDIIGSRNVALKAVDALKLPESPSAQELFQEVAQGRGSIRDVLADVLLKGLKVQPSRESNVVEVSYTATDPRFAAAVANAIVQSYVRTNLELKTEPARQVGTWFDEQIKVLRANLEKAQERLSEYQQKTGIVATEERLDVENARLNEISTQVVAIQAAAQDAQSRMRQVDDLVKRGGAVDTSPDVLANPLIVQLKQAVAQQEAKVSELSSKMGTSHPQYEAAMSELESLRARLKQELKTVATTIGGQASITQQREASLKAALAAQKAKVLELRQQRDEVSVLSRDVENAQRAYDGALQRLSQTRLEGQVNQTNIAVLTPAIEPLERSSPKMLLNLALAVFIGTLLGVGAALVVEMLDRPVRTETDIVEALGLPLLASIPGGGNGTRRWRLPGRHTPA